MGLLSLGTPLPWEESRKFNEHVRDHGITQLINMFKQHSHRENDTFLWGDEVEYMIVDVDPEAKTAKISIDYDHIITDLNDEHISLYKSEENNISFHPEYGRYMIEGTPLRPYNGEDLSDYAYVEQNMEKRRTIGNAELPSHIKLISFTVFPRLGCPQFTSPEAKPIGPASQSLFLPDEIINRHVRFPTLTANIRKRRGCKVAINLPLYPDVNTKLVDDSIPIDRGLYPSDKEPSLGASKPGHVYMDSMGFGMGSSCLQVTMQASNIREARYLYDTLAPVTPILLSMSAASPIFRGFLVDQDVRWNVISGAVDDRTFIERNVAPYKGYDRTGGLDVKEEVSTYCEKYNADGDYENLKTEDGKPVQYIPKSRYDSIDNYLSDESYGTGYYSPRYNDLYSPINSKVYERLASEPLFDADLARHFAHLFIRDPLVIFNESIAGLDDTLDNDHFENIQSTNWQTLRFKPPALYAPGTDLKSKPGWRVEVRPLEIQITDFENAAYSDFVALLAKAVVKFKPNWYIPLSKVDKNMVTAHKVDSNLKDKFWFKNVDNWNVDDLDTYNLTWLSNYISGVSNGVSNGVAASSNGSTKSSINPIDEIEYSVDELVNGNHKRPGLINLIVKLLATEFIPSHSGSKADLLANLTKIKYYLLLVSRRASGEIPTMAHWIRSKVLTSKLYKQDSKVSQEINYDLVQDVLSLTDLRDTVLLREVFGEEIAEYLLS